MAMGTVREWHDDLGWGVLDSDETPGGCWAHFSAVASPEFGSAGRAQVSAFKSLAARDAVDFEWETPGQDGFEFRATSVTLRP